jgi:hypothetical protein
MLAHDLSDTPTYTFAKKYASTEGDEERAKITIFIKETPTNLACQIDSTTWSGRPCVYSEN